MVRDDMWGNVRQCARKGSLQPVPATPAWSITHDGYVCNSWNTPDLLNPGLNPVLHHIELPTLT
jgi:hypothetical protein